MNANLRVLPAVLLVGLILPSCTRCSTEKASDTSAAPEESNLALEDDLELIEPDGEELDVVASAATGDLEITDVVVGAGAEIKEGQELTVHYTGTRQDGTKFDSSVDRGEPIKFIFGDGNLIRGWELGLKGMRVGGKRLLVIPPHLAYGEEGMGVAIPPNATLTFEIELLEAE